MFYFGGDILSLGEGKVFGDVFHDGGVAQTAGEQRSDAQKVVSYVGRGGYGFRLVSPCFQGLGVEEVHVAHQRVGDE